MCCPGGCIGGGGQPQPTTEEIRQGDIPAIYDEDAWNAIRKSHENPAVKALYEEFLGEPLSHKTHELLHTTYTAPERITIKKIEEAPRKVPVDDGELTGKGCSTRMGGAGPPPIFIWEWYNAGVTEALPFEKEVCNAILPEHANTNTEKISLFARTAIRSS